MNMDSLSSLATEHLFLRLQPLNRALRSAVENQRIASARLSRPDLAPLCVTDDHVNILLEQVDISQSGNALPGVPAVLTDEEQSVEAELRSKCSSLSRSLPLDQLASSLNLLPFEQESLLLCAAPELDSTYERIFAFILDDLNRRFPCLDLLISLTSVSVEERIARRHSLSSIGTLRRSGVLLPFGDPPTDLRQELRLVPGIFEFLTGAPTAMARLCRDRAEILIPSSVEPPPQVSPGEFLHFRDALADGTVSVFGVWGPRQNGVSDFVLALAGELHRPLRRVFLPDLDRASGDLARNLQEQIRTASGLAAALWFDADALTDPGRERLQNLLAEFFANSPVPVFLTGEQPWRPAAILRSGSYAELELSQPPSQSCLKLWSHNLPELEQNELARLASRYTLSGTDIRAVSELTRVRARLGGNGHPEPVKDHVAAACSLVTRPSSCHFGLIIQPKRTPDDLVLPSNLHNQIVEVAAFFDLTSRVDGEWGFGHLTGSCGTKALFTGEPGTGKTLAAEVIAGLLGLPLLKVDLARIVSKWVGETEKNLESAFREAEESHCVLFFDEAEALFGKRAEVQHGTDRYANLEVSYLLQRLESSPGLVILASNVKDQIDYAFIRRFQVVVHFPKPGVAERLRIWKRALPAAAPLDADVDLEALARLDMTGAAIVSSARTAAFLAADSGALRIKMADLVRATARQFRREARVLTPADLGTHGALLQGAS
jgi:hypothetical protein